jgi:hypothetical protein
MAAKEEYVENRPPFYEGPNGTCKFDKPTLINMGEDRPLHLMYPVHWSHVHHVLPSAKTMASKHDALLVLLIYGEASDSEIQSLILELADAQVLPLWIGEENRKKLDRIITLLSHSQ